jgi:hypothetical protein
MSSIALDRDFGGKDEPDKPARRVGWNIDARDGLSGPAWAIGGRLACVSNDALPTGCRHGPKRCKFGVEGVELAGLMV